MDAGINCVPVSIYLILGALHSAISRPPTLSILVNIFSDDVIERVTAERG